MQENKVKKKRLTEKTISGFIWMFSSSGITAIVQMILLIILSRLLLPEEFGIVNISLVIIGFSKIFFMLGVGPAIVQLPNLESGHIRNGFAISFFLGNLIAVMVYFGSSVISSFFNMEELERVIKVLSLLYPIEGLSVVALSLLERELKFNIIAKISVLSYVIGYALTGVLLAFLGFGIWALVFANLVQSLFKMILLFYHQRHPIVPTFNIRIIKELLFFGGGITLGRINNYIAQQGDTVIVGKLLNPESVGIYNRAYQLMNIPSVLFGQIMDKVLFPAMSKIQQNRIAITNVYKYGIEFTAVTMIPLSVVVLILAPEIVDVMLGKSWFHAAELLKVFAIGMLFRTSYKISETVARAKGAVYRIAYLEFIYAVVIILGTLMGIYFGGLKGASIGVLIALFIQFVQKSHLAISFVNINWKDFIGLHSRAMLFSIILAILSYLITSLMRMFNLNSLLVIIVIVSIYLFSLLIVFKVQPRILLSNHSLNKFYEIIESNSFLRKKLKRLVNIIK